MKLRGILRTLGTTEVEEKLFGNSSEKLKSYDIPYEEKYNWQEKFEQRNDRNNFFLSNPKIIETFKKLYYTIKLSQEINGVRSYSSTPYSELAYKMMIYFGYDDAELILKRFDHYIEHNELTSLALEKVFKHEFYHHSGFKYLSSWQNILENSNSPRIFCLFKLAAEIEEELSKKPSSSEEIQIAASTLPTKSKWERKQLLTMFLLCENDEAQLNFINTISDENIKTLVDTSYHFEEMVQAMDEKNQLALLRRLGNEYVQTFYNFSSTYDFERSIKHIKTANINFFIQEILGLTKFTELYKDLFSLKYLMDNLPKQYDVTTLFSFYSEEQLNSLFAKRIYVEEILNKIKLENRFDFLLHTIGKKRCYLLIDSAYQLSKIIGTLPIEIRVDFIKQIFEPNQLLTMHKENRS